MEQDPSPLETPLPDSNPETALRGFKALSENPYFLSLVQQLDKDFGLTINKLLDPPGLLTGEHALALIGEARGYARLKGLLSVVVAHLDERRKQQEQPNNEDQNEESDSSAQDS